MTRSCLAKAGNYLFIVILLTTAACSDAPAPSSAAADVTGALAVTAPDEVQVIVLGHGRYLVDGKPEVTLDSGLEDALRDAARSRAPEPTTVILYVHGDLDESVRGYSSVVALNAAARAGFLTAKAVDNYVGDTSPEAQAAWVMLPEVDLPARHRRQLASQPADSALSHDE